MKNSTKFYTFYIKIIIDENLQNVRQMLPVCLLCFCCLGHECRCEHRCLWCI